MCVCVSVSSIGVRNTFIKENSTSDSEISFKSLTHQTIAYTTGLLKHHISLTDTISCVQILDIVNMYTLWCMFVENKTWQY